MAVKVPKPLKDRMSKLKAKVDWADEIRNFVEERTRQAEVDERIQQVVDVELLRKTGQVRKGFSAASTREDRDSR